MADNATLVDLRHQLDKMMAIATEHGVTSFHMTIITGNHENVVHYTTGDLVKLAGELENRVEEMRSGIR